MAKAKPVNGKDLMLFVGGKAIALARTFSLTLNTETLDASSKDDGIWEANEIVDARNFDITSDAVFTADEDRENLDQTYDSLFDLFVAGTPVDFVCGIPTNASAGVNGVPEQGWTPPTSAGYKGKMMITSLAMNGNRGEAATLTVNGRGVGAMTKLKTH